ncbi:hypothetical protein AVEN_15892-1 [Araneus ventricosus]|uniref:Secreted protein n=1 Tax=Araneus ventricosus TaxID=182803 RepID=A0A4Y2R7E4_ARAVE|nr:hypothetical protein AVEN_15892-1 [Araneus ventricosus]
MVLFPRLLFIFFIKSGSQAVGLGSMEHLNTSIQGRHFFLLVSLTTGLSERMRHELDSPNLGDLGGDLKQKTTPCYNLFFIRPKMVCDEQG